MTEFVLPENWCVKVTEENRLTLIAWRSDPQVPGTGDLSINAVGGYLHSSKIWSRTGMTLYKEITFKEFEEFVLKDNFVLPERWAVAWNTEVGEYFAKQAGVEEYFYPTDEDISSGKRANRTWDVLSSHNYSGQTILNPEGKSHLDASFADAGGEVITFQQFKKHILDAQEPPILNEDVSYLANFFKERNIT